MIIFWLHLQVKNKFSANKYVKWISVSMSSGNGHNLDLSLGISNGSKGKDNAGDCLSRCNRERLMVALQSFTMFTLFFCV